MAKFLEKRTVAEAQPPGSRAFIGSQKMEDPKIQIFGFDYVGSRADSGNWNVGLF